MAGQTMDAIMSHDIKWIKNCNDGYYPDGTKFEESDLGGHNTF
jgi:hypothetical protein